MAAGCVREDVNVLVGRSDIQLSIRAKSQAGGQRHLGIERERETRRKLAALDDDQGRSRGGQRWGGGGGFRSGSRRAPGRESWGSLQPGCIPPRGYAGRP